MAGSALRFTLLVWYDHFCSCISEGPWRQLDCDLNALSQSGALGAESPRRTLQLPGQMSHTPKYLEHTSHNVNMEVRL